MDTISDILSTIFVSSNVRRRKTVQAELDKIEEQRNNDKRSERSERSERDKRSNDKRSNDDRIEEQRSERSERSERSNDDRIEEQRSERGERDKRSEREQSERDKRSERVYQIWSESSDLEVEEPQHHPRTQTQPKKKTEGPKMRKFAMRATDLRKKTVLIANTDVEDCVQTLGDLLHMLGLMDNIRDVYSNDVHLFVPPEHKKEYNTMLLENPYLYFTNFDTSNSLTKAKYKELQGCVKKNIVIVDLQTLKDPVKELSDLRGMRNLHVLAIATKLDDNISAICNKKNVLLIHKNEKLKSLQKMFFTKVVSKCCAAFKGVPFPDFQENVIKDYLVRFLVIKGSELRYM